MVAMFYLYLLYNEYTARQVTVLSFYAGQVKQIRHEMSKHSLLKQLPVKLHTVDSYQGEENEIVLLSLVRSNWDNNIGFLSVVNRACVALSRARTGFYLFGSRGTLEGSEDPSWSAVLGSLQSFGGIVEALPLVCARHGRETNATGEQPIPFRALALPLTYRSRHRDQFPPRRM